MAKQINELLVAQGGVRIPTSAATGKFAVSDSSGNISWRTIATADLPGAAVSVSSGQGAAAGGVLQGLTPNLAYKPTKLGFVLQPGASGQWDSSMVDACDVFWDANAQRWCMAYMGYSGAFTGGFPTAASVAKIGIAWSDDGVNWTKDAANPIFSPTGNAGIGGDWDGGLVGAPRIFYEGGTYYMFYIGGQYNGWETSQGGHLQIGVATASSLTGTWTRYAGNPIIPRAGSGWRANNTFRPSVVKSGSTYYCFFNASDNVPNEKIGYASAPAILGTWTVDDTNSPLLAYGAGGTWDSTYQNDPYVFQGSDGNWYMAYGGLGAANPSGGWAWTTPANFPLGWVKATGNPFIQMTESWNGRSFKTCAVIRRGASTLHYFVAGDSANNTTAVALAVASPPVDPSGYLDHIAHQPSDSGLLAETIDPAVITSNFSSSSGFIVLSKFWVPKTITVANLIVFVSAAGSTLTSAQNLAGIYDSNGNLIAQSADQTTPWASTGGKTMALTAQSGRTLELQGGPGVWYWAAVLAKGTTPPKFASTPVLSAQIFNAGKGINYSAAVPGAQHRSAYESAGARTSLISLSGLTLNEWDTQLWAGLT